MCKSKKDTIFCISKNLTLKKTKYHNHQLSSILEIMLDFIHTSNYFYYLLYKTGIQAFLMKNGKTIAVFINIKFV